MKLIALILITFVILLVMLGKLLSDVKIFLYRITKEIFSFRNKGALYLGEVIMTVFTCIFITVFAFIFFKFSTALVAWFFSENLIEYFSCIRSVFNCTSKLRDPFHYFIPNLIIIPCLQFVTVFLIFRSIRKFFTFINRKYDSCYNELDSFYFGLFCVIILMFMDIGIFAQNMQQLNAKIVHFTLLATSKISYLIHYLILTHINYLYFDDYRNSLPKYVTFTMKTEEKITHSPYKGIFFSYITNVLLLLPFHFGIQFFRSDLWVLFLFIIICALFICFFRLTLSKGLNYIGTIALNNSLSVISITDNFYKINKKWNKILIITTLFFSFFFIAIYYNVFFMFILLLSFSIALACAFLIMVYCLGLALTNLNKAQLFEVNTFKIDIIAYIKNVFVAAGKTILPFLIIIFFIFQLLTLFPKPLKYCNKAISTSLVDRDNNILYVKRLQNNDFCIPLGYDDIPPFLIKCIINQEDKGFNRQNNWFPNTSNWHGISPALFLRNRGGSNLNMQLIKNLSFEKTFPQDISRKISELFAAYMLSISQKKKDIFTFYVNTVGVHGAAGYKGFEAASLSAFGRQLNMINYLELMYLVTTLPRNDFYLTINKKEIKYRDTNNYTAEIKRTVVAKAEKWYRKGLITKKELNQLKSDTLRFTNQFFNTCLSSSSRLFLEKQLKDNTEKKYIGSMTKINQEKLEIAFKEFSRNRYFPITLQVGDCNLYATVLVVDYHTGNILGHYCNHNTVDLSSFGNGFPIASLIKPFILLEMLEENIEISLYDGKINNKKTPRNDKHQYTNKFLGPKHILSRSLNAPMVNLREVCDAKMLFSKVEEKFASMGIPSLPIQDTYNYSLGCRNITLYNIAQAYQCLLNDGLYKKLSVVESFFNTQKNIIETLSQKPIIQLYKNQNVDIIKDALTYTLKDGTAACLKQILPKDKRFYIKTGTSDGANHGYTLLADDDIFIISHVTYGRIINGTLILNATPPIPYSSGANSAGVLAAYVYNQFKTK